jgi:aerobic-type carbon monoxide dehydrogenase small subunit (CoxS/CutS family)
MNNISITLQINGKEHSINIPSNQTLIETLQEVVELSGTRDPCGIGMCGGCTVLVNEKAISSCLTLTAQMEGKEITTIEGLEKNGLLHPVQQSFTEHNAFQCGYCTPGFIMSTVALLEENPNPNDDETREYLAGNLCRCGSYVNILKAVKSVKQYD